ncbi:MAG: septum site-determining protein MinC [Coprobacillaceae bacterium]
MRIKIKSLNDRLIFVFDEKESFNNLIEELKSLLEKPIFSSDGFFPKAFFDFKSRILEEEELEQLLDLLFSKQVVLFEGISGIEEEKKSKIKVINRTIHAGEVVHVNQDTLIIGHINAGAVVTFTDKLYVLGDIRGMVEGVNQNSKISGQSFKDAHIRINGISRHSYTSLELTMLYYRDNDIFLDKGEMIYV